MASKITDLAELLRNLVNQTLSTHGTNETNAVIVQTIGTALAYALPLPHEEITEQSVEEYFNNFYRRNVTRIVGELNEEFIVDTATITRVTVQMWLLRYRLVFNPRAAAGVIHGLARLEGIFPEFVNEGLEKVYSNSHNNEALTNANVSAHALINAIVSPDESTHAEDTVII